MTLATMFLSCFFVGLFWSVLTPLIGGHHWHFLGLHGHGHHPGHAKLSPISPTTVATFLAWYGGVGYLFLRYSPAWTLLALGAGAVAGLCGSAAVFFLLGKLEHADHALEPADFELVGVLGRVSSTIIPGGVGEILFSQAGARRSLAARASVADPIECGTEVVVLAYENGIAQVRRLEELAPSESQVSR